MLNKNSLGNFYLDINFMALMKTLNPLLMQARKEKRPTVPGWAFVFGGASGIRTPDLRIMIPSL